MRVDKATIANATSIHQTINRFADKGEMLPRALSEIYEDIRDFFVVRNEGEVAACVALHVSWLDLAEIRSLAVDEKYQNRGIGSLLVKACLDEAKELGIPTVFCLTYKPAFFQKQGFGTFKKEKYALIKILKK